jgi:glycosyltransferase involved in cell wall biosynthesis
MEENKKAILMIYDHLHIGGIETLIIRSSIWLLENGYKVKLILRDRGDLFDTLDPRVQVRTYHHLYELLYTPLFARMIFCSDFFSKIDIVYTFRPEGLWIASVLAKVRKVKLKVFNCVYHPHEFFIRGVGHYETTFFSKVLMSAFPKKNLAFMNQPCKLAHEVFFDTVFRDSFLFPLPVSNNAFVQINRRPTKYKIVSIGNLKSFKTYNIYMIHIVKKLIDEGIPVVYEIYGEGEMRREMEELISKNNLSQYVKLNGQVQYKNFSSALEDAYLFVGMGTAAIEAALCKVPTIVAIADHSRTHGYLYDMPGFAVGEKIEGIGEFEVEALIKRVAFLSDQQYERECLRNYNYALKYNLQELMEGITAKFESEYGIDRHLFEDLQPNLYYRFYLQRLLNKVNHQFSSLYNRYAVKWSSPNKLPQRIELDS